jgi:hypothetical protein
MLDADNVESLDAQLKSLRASISDLGYQVDSYKTKTAAALGAGVFLVFLAAAAVYDLVVRKGGVWLVLGVTRETLGWIASALGISATILLMLGFRRVRMSNTGVRAELDLMERRYAELLERRDEGARGSS